MTDEVKRLVNALREDAEWAHANEWETPITLSDHLEAAADLIDKLLANLEQVKNDLIDAQLQHRTERCEDAIFAKSA